MKELKSMVQVGIKYKVSDNAVRKWIKNYEKIDDMEYTMHNSTYNIIKRNILKTIERIKKENELSEKYNLSSDDLEYVTLEKFKAQNLNYTPLILVFYLDRNLFTKQKWEWFHKEYPNSELWNEKKLIEMRIL